MELTEFSPDTPQGSKSRDLNVSKLWLCHELTRLGHVQFDTVYILGSWYGTMPMFLINKHIVFNHCYCVDWNREKTEYVDHVAKRMKLDGVEAICKDANSIKYHGDSILVINTSTNDIQGREWLKNIPSSSVVALQGRDQQEYSNGIESLDKFDQVYKLSKTLLLDSIVLEGVEGDIYTRFMKIGIK